ncbi:MAG: AEC family transporter [Tyzzerella sp.]|uniref:AEC family transporter n=1 Tax=Candidatus Fimicola merdigallinarum TaxID=2840819 RepID=A0A9D9H4S8_9FIRM|nr:AEC family transporter [Candidatus Fimicola merdigallinarum]
MGGILTRSIGFLIMMLVGYLFKKNKIITVEDGRVISKIIVNITLPMALASGFQGVTITKTLVSMTFLGILANAIMLVVGFIVARKKGSMDKVFYMLNLSSYNIGNFTIPFAQAFFPASTLAALYLFDVGNGLMCLGISIAIVSSIVNSSSKFSLKEFLKILFSSPSFVTYVIMVSLTALKISLPDSVFTIVKMVGSSNTFLSMFLIGILFELNVDKDSIKTVLRVIFIRYGFALIFALIIFFILPYSRDIRSIIAMTVFAPIVSVAPIHCEKLGSDHTLAGFLNSVCIIISLVLMTLTLILVG